MSENTADRGIGVDLVKQFILSCREADSIIAQMPELPDGLTPRHVRVADYIQRCADRQDEVHVSDIADSMGATRPSVTKLIHQFEEKGYLTKKQSDRDHRVFIISFTDKGKAFYRKYISGYFGWVSRCLSSVDPGEMRTAINVINSARRAIAENKYDEEMKQNEQ